MITMMCVTRADLIHEFACRLTQWPAEVIDRFVSTIRKAIFGVLVGVVFVALIQGFLCGVGFAIAEVPQPAFWGLIAAFVAPIPFVGTALVWLPVCIWLWLTGSTVALHRPCHLVCAGRSRGGQPASPLLPEDGDRRVGRYADPLHPLRPRRVWAGRRLRGAGARRRRHSGRQRGVPSAASTEHDDAINPKGGYPRLFLWPNATGIYRKHIEISSQLIDGERKPL